MKETIAFSLLFFILLLFLVGCNRQAGEINEPTPIDNDLNELNELGEDSAEQELETLDQDLEFIEEL